MGRDSTEKPLDDVVSEPAVLDYACFREGKKRGHFWQETANLAGGVLGAVASYNLAGLACENLDIGYNGERFLTAGLLTAGTILGYKARGIGKRCLKRFRRSKARADFLREVSDDEDFLERRGIRKGEFGRVRKGLKYLLTVPAGGVLGLAPGLIGIAPLCAYFGENYRWGEGGYLDSGPVAGAVIGAYAFAEMTKKGNNKRMVVSGSAMTSASIFYLAASEAVEDVGLWAWLGFAAFFASMGGMVGRSVFDGVRKMWRR